MSRSPWITSVGTVAANSLASRTSFRALSIELGEGPSRINASACAAELAAPYITPEWIAQAANNRLWRTANRQAIAPPADSPTT